MKKLWEKPKLVVLVRGRPEEAVLAFCKTGNNNPHGSASEAKQGCQFKTVDTCNPECEHSQDT